MCPATRSGFDHEAFARATAAMGAGDDAPLGDSRHGPLSLDAEIAATERLQRQGIIRGGPDLVTMPSHYARHKVEPIRFAVENYGPGFLIGNIVKYVTRYDAKDGHKDLAKAARYVEMLRRYEAGDPGWYTAEPFDGELPASPSDPLRTHGKAQVTTRG